MGQTLTGQIVAETYDALIKVTDNNTITGTKKRMTDGVGNDTPLLISSTDVQVDGNFLTEGVQFNTATLQTADTVGKLAWNDQDGTLDLRLKGGNVTLQVGQEQVSRVVNKTGINLLEANYQVVRVDGAQGNRLKVALAQANNDANSAETLGVVTETINDNQEGFITTSGIVRNINTTGSLQGETWADGNMLYLSGTTAGRLTNVKPSAPTHTVIMGYVVRAHATQGQIYVKVDNGYELDELHNVSITTPTDGQVLAYESATGLWKNTTNGNIGGSGTTNYVAKFTGSTSLGNSLIFDNGTKVGIATASPYEKLDVTGDIGSTGGFWAKSGSAFLFGDSGSSNAYIGGDGGATSFITLNTNGTERLRIVNGGNVGIGVTNPLMKLDLFGTSGLPATSGTTPVGSLRLHASNNAVLDFGVDNGTANGWIQSTDQAGLNNYYSLLLNPRGGNVGIGTTSPAGKLSVYQSAGTTATPVIATQHAASTGTQFATHISFLNSSGSQAGFISANGSATFYGTSSDYRLKQDLKDYSGLSIISSIKTYDYEWKADKSRMYGVLAHELQEVVPYAINGEKDGEQMQGVDYSKLVPILVKAIQELTEKVNQLENK